MASRFMVDRRLLAYLTVAELTSVAFIASWYRATARPDPALFLSSPGGVLFLFLGLELVICVYGAASQTFTVFRSDQRRLVRTVGVNALAFLGVLISGEVGVRMLVEKTPTGPVLAHRELHPYVWKEFAAGYAKRLQEDRTEQFFIFDPLLGWNVMPNSTGQKGLFQSSAHGIRTSRAGTEYADANPGCRIALLGDSFVFGQDSAFENTWGRQLERSLSNGCQVLNFGVPGYGFGQMYLRYQKDAQLFHPDVVVVGFTDGVVNRTAGVYGFLAFPGGDTLWPIPRYVLDHQQLRLINVPLIPLEAIYSSPSIEDLPYIRYSWYYEPTIWEMPGWHQLSRSYLFRTYVTLFPLHTQPRPEVSTEEVRAVNIELLRSLERDIRANGAVLLLVYFPNWNDYQGSRSQPGLTRPILREGGLDYDDLTECLGRVDAERRFLSKNGHYRSEGESAVAECLSPIIRTHLTDTGTGMRRASHK